MQGLILSPGNFFLYFQLSESDYFFCNLFLFFTFHCFRKQYSVSIMYCIMVFYALNCVNRSQDGRHISFSVRVDEVIGCL